MEKNNLQDFSEKIDLINFVFANHHFDKHEREVENPEITDLGIRSGKLVLYYDYYSDFLDDYIASNDAYIPVNLDKKSLIEGLKSVNLEDSDNVVDFVLNLEHSCFPKDFATLTDKLHQEENEEIKNYLIKEPDDISSYENWYEDFYGEKIKIDDVNKFFNNNDVSKEEEMTI